MKKLVALFFILLLLTSFWLAYAEYTDSETILAVQQVLADAGIYKGNISGIKGNATEAAIRTYQQKNGLKVSGQIDEELLNCLGLLENENKANDGMLIDPTIEAIGNERILRLALEYNTVSNYPLHDFSQGNIITKYYAFTNDCLIEMIDVNNAWDDYIHISINGGNKKETIEKMFTVFPILLSALDTSLSDAEIREANNSLKNGYRTTIKVGSTIEVNYIPSVKLSWGYNDARIDIVCNNF